MSLQLPNASAMPMRVSFGELFAENDAMRAETVTLRRAERSSGENRFVAMGDDASHSVFILSFYTLLLQRNILIVSSRRRLWSFLKSDNSDVD